MSRLIFCRFVTVMILLAVGLPALANARYKVGQDVEFEMVTADDEKFSSQDLKGKLVVVEFWATWCGPCVRMIPHLREINSEYKSQGVAMISVSVDSKRDLPKARKMIREKRMAWTMVLDAEQGRPLDKQFFKGGYGIPHAFLISPDGKLLWEGHPGSLEKQIKSALKTHSPYEYSGEEAGDADALPSDALELAKLARMAVAGEPEFRQLLILAKALPEDQLTHAKVKSFGRSVKRALGKLEGDMLEVYEAYRENDPEGAAALDLWLTSASGSISDGTEGNFHEASPRQVARKFKQGEKAEAAGDMVTAYECYRWIVNRAPNSDEAMLAQDVVLTLEADPEFMAQLEQQAREKAAADLMKMAANYINAEMSEKAEQVYQDVIDQYPTTQAAKDAKAALQ